MARSRGGLEAAGEWHQLKPMFPDMTGMHVLDLGCGYGWHCKYAAEQFNMVISNLVLHYVENLDVVYQNVHRTLKSGGVFLFNIEHPTFTTGVNQDWIYDDEGNPLYWPVDRYYEPGERETLFLGKKVRKQHHTLTQVLNGLLANGFSIEHVEEAMPSPEMMEIPE